MHAPEPRPMKSAAPSDESVGEVDSKAAFPNLHRREPSIVLSAETNQSSDETKSVVPSAERVGEEFTPSHSASQRASFHRSEPSVVSSAYMLSV